jgi:CubicO group peptidase (beta-lactamase class C family)
MEPIAPTIKWQPIPDTAPQHSAIDPAALEQARSYAAAARSSALIVWRAGRIETQWYAPGVGPSTPLVSKSLSKPLTAIAIGRAIKLGKIASLDQSIADFIPELRGTQKGRILVRHLLDMRSGMLDQGFSTDPQHPLNRGYLDPDHGRRIVEDYPMIAEPGTRYSYANAPSDLIAMVIERATGRRYAEFISTEVIRPLGAQGGEIWVDRKGGLAHSGCCTLMPAETWLRLAVLLLDDGMWNGKRLLPKGYVAQMRKGTAQNPSYGLGIWLGEPYRQRRGFGAPGMPGPQVLHSEPYLDPDLFLFDGNSNQTVQISPRNRLIVLRMGPTPPASPEWDNAVLPNLLIRGLKPATKR